VSQPGVEPGTSCTAGDTLCKEPFERRYFLPFGISACAATAPPQATMSQALFFVLWGSWLLTLVLSAIERTKQMSILALQGLNLALVEIPPEVSNLALTLGKKKSQEVSKLDLVEFILLAHRECQFWDLKVSNCKQIMQI